MGYSSSFAPGPIKDWYESTYELNAQRCLRAGAAHDLLKHAGFRHCWRCYVSLSEAVTWDDVRIIHGIVPLPPSSESQRIYIGLTGEHYTYELPRPLHVINAIESNESAE